MPNPPSEQQLRSLVGLLDEEDPNNYNLVRQQILTIGEPILPFLDELRAHGAGETAARADSVARELRFQNLRAAFTRLATSVEPDLEEGTLLLARFGYPGIDTSLYTGWLDRVANQIRRDLPSSADAALRFQRLNALLFHAMGFTGNETRYYDPDNSYVNRVIETRRGIPVSLSVLYLLLGQRLNLPIYGVGTPGHFLIGFEQDGDACYLDTFNRGHILSLSDVRRMLLRSGYEFRPEFIRPCSSRDIVIRMMRNLISVYQKMSASDRADMLSGLVEIMLTGRSRTHSP